MSSPVLRRAALLSFILLCAAVESPPRAPAAQGAAPETLQGVYRYRVRGLTAGAGAFSGMIKAQATGYAAMHRMVPAFFKILGGMAKVSNDPSAKEMHDFLRSADRFGVNFSTIPIAAGYGLEVEFTLEQVKKEWRLKRGSYRWSSDHHWSFSAGEGSIVENVRGQGSGTLDPKTASITLLDTGKKGSPRLELFGDIPLTSGFAAGKSVFTNGPIRWAFDHGKGEVEIVMAGLAAIRDKLGEPGENYSVGHISFSKSGPPRRVIKGMEVYQDLLDSGVVEEWELWPRCAAQIESPGDKEDLVFNDRKPGQLIDTALAEVQPSFWGDDLHWLLPEIAGSELEPPPKKANGNDFDMVYTNLPEQNSAFRITKVIAHFDTDRAKQAGCEDPKPTEVGYFFAREALNHGGPAGPKSPGNPDQNLPNPNWFHYWMQTKANVGLPTSFVRYGGKDPSCATALGYYRFGERFVILCENEWFVHWNEFSDITYTGIDAFATILLHEKQHHDNYWRWWPGGYGTAADPSTEPLDADGDHIPDLLESSMSIPAGVKSKTGRTKFSPNAYDSFGYKMDDEHYLAYAAENRWKAGSANAEDWACPGKQGLTEECRQP